MPEYEECDDAVIEIPCGQCAALIRFKKEELLAMMTPGNFRYECECGFRGVLTHDGIVEALAAEEHRLARKEEERRINNAYMRDFMN